jgi:hypothetical protein
VSRHTHARAGRYPVAPRLDQSPDNSSC